MECRLRNMKLFHDLFKHLASSFSDRLSDPAVCNVDATVTTLPLLVEGLLDVQTQHVGGLLQKQNHTRKGEHAVGRP